MGRDAEREVVASFLDAIPRAGGALTLGGAVGIGKTALWRATIEDAAARGYRVLSATAVESEAKLSFATLTDLLADVEPVLFEGLPTPQRRALEIALLRADPGRHAPDRRSVFTALYSVLRRLSDDGPVLVAMDDVQWLDRPSSAAIEFAMRRLAGHQIGLLACVRMPDDQRADAALQGSPDARARRLTVGPMSLSALHQLIKVRLGVALPRPVAVRVQQASGGNPLFALEIARELPRDRALPPGEALPVPGDVRELTLERIGRLPARTRQALLVAAAVSNPTVELLGSSGLARAEQAGLIEVGMDGRVAFTHPFYASTVYAAATPERRHQVHRDLAARVSDVEERARHLALGCGGPNARVAGVLDRAADRARSRGAPDIAAELEERARELTPPARPGDATRRGIAAAEHHFHAGDRARARAVLEEVLAEIERGPARARSLRLLAEVRQQEDSVPEATTLLYEALENAGDDPALRARIELDLAYALVGVADFEGAAPHARQALTEAEQLGDPRLLGAALAVWAMLEFMLGHGVDERALGRSLDLEDLDFATPVEMRPSFIAGLLRLYTGRLDQARRHLDELRHGLTERGEEPSLANPTLHLAWVACLSGDLAQADQLVDEGLEIALQAGSETMSAFALAHRALVDAQAGRVHAARSAAEQALAGFERTGWPVGVRWALAALGGLALSLGDAAGALEVLEPLTATVEAGGLTEPIVAFFLADAVEAMIALGDLDRGQRLASMLEERGRALGRAWALATGARCHGLLLAARGDLRAAGAMLERALAEHEHLPMPLERGRTLLVKGTIERRRKARGAAGETLRAALATFEQVGAPLWAQRAREELQRVGVRTSDPDELTATEQRVAELASSGLRNREIAERLFISPKTVEANLARAYRKLGIHSRAELGARMGERREVPAER